MRQTPYAGRRLLGLVETLLVLACIGAGIGGPLYAINGATQAPAYVEVPVAVDAEMLPGGRGAVDLPGQAEDAFLDYGDGATSTLHAWGSTIPEQLLARGHWAFGGLALGYVAFLLQQVVVHIGEGRPFHPGNARRLAWTAGTVGVAGVVAPLLPQVASAMVLDRIGMVGPDSPLAVADGPSVLVPIGAAVLLLVVAEVFRQGEQLQQRVEQTNSRTATPTP